MGENNETYHELLAATEFVAMVTSGEDGPHLVGTWGEYVRRLNPNAGTIVVPVGGYRQTEKNLARDNRIKLLIASRQVQGSSGPGQACEITGTAELVTEGPIVDEVKRNFRWARGALVVTIKGIATQL
jgi:hypothetical protein